MARELTRQMLEEMGVVDIQYDPLDPKQWKIYKKGGSRKNPETIGIEKMAHVPKHTPNIKYYYKVRIQHKTNRWRIPLARVIYAWFNGSVDERDVDHINNNSLDNRLENLQLLTRKENMHKRLVDNPDMCWNHHDAFKKYGK